MPTRDVIAPRPPARSAARGLGLAGLLALAGCDLIGADESPRAVVPTVRVEHFEPSGQLSTTRTLRVRFSVPMVSEDAVGRDQDPSEVIVVTPELGGRGRWTAVDTFELEPGRPLAPNTRYAARVRERVVGPGRRLEGRRRFRFRTPLFRVMSARGEKAGAALQATIELSHAVLADDAAGAISFRDVDGRVLAARLLAGGSARILRFSIPSAGVDPDDGVRMRVEPTLAPAVGGVTLDKPVAMALAFDPPPTPEVRSAQVLLTDEGPAIRVHLDVDVDPVRAAPFVRTEPPSSFEVLGEHLGFRLQGGLRPDTDYRVLLREGMPTEVGVLEADAELEVHVPELPPSVRFVAHGPFLVSEADALSLDVVNARRLRVRAVRVPDRNVAFVDPHADDPSALGQVVAERILEGGADRSLRMDVPVAGLLRGGRGLYRIEVQDLEHAWVRAAGWLVQRNLHVAAKLGDDYLQARVHHPQSLRSVSGAEVSAYSRTGRRLFRAITDARGVARYIGPLDPEDPVVWLVAHKGRDAAYLPMEEGRVPLLEREVRPHPLAFVWTARDYLRGADTVHAAALLERPARAPLRFELSGPEGPVGEPVSAAPEGGLVRADLALPRGASAGRYTVRLLDAGGARLGRASLHVGEATAPALRIDVRPPSALAPGAPVPFEVKVRSRFGGRTAGFAVEGRCRQTPVPIEAESLPGFRFGLPRAVAAPRVADAPATKVGEGGVATVVCPAPAADISPGHRVKVDVQVSVLEPGGRPVQGVAEVLTDPVRHYIGLRHRDGALEAVAVDAEGAAVSAAPIAARIVGPIAGRMPPATTRLDVVSEARPLRLAHAPPYAGRYRVEVQSGSDRVAAALDYWVLTGTAASPLPHVEVTLPEAAPEVGEALPVAVKLPAPGRLRVTVERGRVLWDQTIDVDRREASFTIPVLAAFAPNAQVVVALEGAQGRRAYGAAALRVGTGRRLDVKVDLPEGASGRRFPVAVRVEGARGRAYALVSVVSADRWAADAETRRDPVAHLAAERPITVSTHDPLGLALERGPMRRRPPPGLSDAPDPTARAPGASEAFVSKIVRLSDRGYGWFAARPPTGGGRALLTVVAFDGTAAGMTVVPLERGVAPALRLAAPPALVPGDRVQVPLTIENVGDRPWTATASASVTGPLELGGPARVRASVPARQRRTVDFTVVASRAGTGDLYTLVEGRGAVSEASAKIEVRAPASLVVRGHGVAVRNQAPQSLRLPAGVDPTSARARVIVGPGRAYRHLAAFDGLWHAATASPVQAALRGQVLLELPSLAKREGKGGADLGRARLKSDLAAVTAAIDVEGRLRMWPAGPFASPEAEMQGALLLMEARRAGRAADSVASRLVIRRLRGVLEDAAAPADLRAIAAYTLARGRERGFVVPDDLVADGASGMQRALAAAALLGSGRITAGRAMLGGDFSPSESPAANGWALLALASVAPGHRAVRPLRDAVEAAASDGRWPTPALDATALVALGRLDRAAPAGRPYWGSLAVGGVIVKRFNSTRTTVLEAPASAWRAGVDLAVTGAGAAQASLSMIGAPDAADRALAAGLDLTRRHVSPGGGAAGQAELGALWATEVTVGASGAEGAGPVEVHVPIPAGFAVEQVWPEEVAGLFAAESGQIEQTAFGLRWRVAVGARPSRLVFTTRAVRPGRFLEPPVEAWRADEPARWGRTAAQTWTVSAP